MNDATALRRLACQLLTFVAVGFMTARILAVENAAEPSLYKRYDRKWPAATPTPSPTFSSNDRARWATVRALVDEGTFVIGQRYDDATAAKGYRDEGILFEDAYRTIDVVMNPQTKEFFSTKPPLLTVMVAGEYRLLKFALGWDIDVQRWQVVCAILITFNVVPFLIYLLLLGRWLDALAVGDTAKLFAFAAACFGTFLTTFSNTLNNHTPAAFCVLFALLPWLRPNAEITFRKCLETGLFAGLAAAFDMPALAFGGLLAGAIALKSPRRAALFALGLAVPLLAQLAINKISMGEWQPIYAKFNDPVAKEWYRYEGSHWKKLNWREEGLPKPAGIDFAEEPKAIYAFHLLLGHHGWFSLTPIFLISLIGLVRPLPAPDSFLSWNRLRILTAVVAVVVFAFYIWTSNNYGGFCSGPRWLFWMTPLFLLHLPAGYAWLEKSKWGQCFAGLCLAVSVFSTTFPIMNPWRLPWLLQLLDYLNWVRY